MGFLCKGLRPLHPRGLNPGGTGTGRQTTHPAGGLVSGVGGSTCRCGTRRGRVFSLPLPPATFSFDSAPYPPAPLPRRGRGSFLVFLCKGLRPLHPRGLNGRGTGIACGKPVLSASNGALAPAGAAETRVVKSRHSAGCLFGKDCKCRERSNAGVPGAAPPAKQTKNFFPPFPAGDGGGGG